MRDDDKRSKAAPATPASRNGTGDCGISRRAVLTGAAAGALALTADQAAAQSWTDVLQGFGIGNGPLQRSERPTAADELTDLRTGTVPWRSEEMLGMMDAAIARYERIVEQGGWPRIAPGKMLRLDDDDDRVIQLKSRLGLSGDLRAAPGYFKSARFDERLEEAVRGFQEQFGLRVTGRADQPTLGQLAAPAQARLEQLKLNQRRIRELLQGRIEDRYILVNTAAYQLEAVEAFEVRRRHRVIVGKPDRQTPNEKAMVRALNFFPYWHVPDSVSNLDLIPRLRKEPDYLEKEHIRAYTPAGVELDRNTIDWRTADASRIKFKQDYGPWCALGLVRIDMPNADIVYMHDTPLKPLFKQRIRPFSAGCVRVEKVFELVEWIARNEAGWDQPGRAQAIIDAGQPLDMNLTRQVPVYFTYITAWAEPDGRAVFRADVYGRDGLRDLVGEKDNEAPPVQQMLAP